MGKVKNQDEKVVILPKPRGKKPRKAVGGDAILARTRTLVSKSGSSAIRSQMEGLINPLTLQDLALFEYTFTLGHPWTREPSGVPAILGTAVVRTSKAQLLYELNIIANASGFAFCSVSIEGWTDNSGTVQSGNLMSSYSGGTQGYPIWYTDSTFAGTTFPTDGATTATAGLLRQQQQLIDPSFGQNQRYRVVAVGLRAVTVAPAQTAQGKLAVISTSRPWSSAANGAIAGSTYATFAGLPEDIADFKSIGIPGMVADRPLACFAVPPGDDAFTMYTPPATGRSTFMYPQMAVMLTGAASGQTANVQIVYDYEFTMGTSNITGTSTDPVMPVGLDNIKMANSLIPGRAHNLNATEAALSPHGSAGFVNYLAATAPGKIAHLNRPALAGGVSSSTSSFGSFIGKGLSLVKGLIESTPWGRVASSGLSLLKSIF